MVAWWWDFYKQKVDNHGVWEPEVLHWERGVGPVRIVADVHLEVNGNRNMKRKKEEGMMGKRIGGGGGGAVDAAGPPRG